MNLKLYQKSSNQFRVGDLVCYKRAPSKKVCGIITEVDRVEKSDMVKIYWCIDKDEVDISPLSYPPVRKNGWIAAGLLRGAGNLEIVSKKKLDK
jgi:hypothetical protein